MTQFYREFEAACLLYCFRGWFVTLEKGLKGLEQREWTNSL